MMAVGGLKLSSFSDEHAFVLQSSNSMMTQHGMKVFEMRDYTKEKGIGIEALRRGRKERLKQWGLEHENARGRIESPVGKACNTR